MDDIYVHVNVNDRLELIQTDFIDNGIKHKSHIHYFTQELELGDDKK